MKGERKWSYICIFWKMGNTRGPILSSATKKHEVVIVDSTS